MYVRRGISFLHVLRDSRFVLGFSLVLALGVYAIHDLLGFEALEVPALPVTAIGIVVSIYLGFQINVTYRRWWEARGIWGDIVNASRAWGNYALSFPDGARGPDGRPDPEARRLVRRHLAWLNALAFQLRARSRMRVSRHPGIFGTREDLRGVLDDATPDRYRSFLAEAEAARVEAMANPAAQIIRLQGDALRGMLDAGRLDSYRFVEMSRLLARLTDAQGQSERIKNTPFPRQFEYFGRFFTWLLIVLMPFAFLDTFTSLAETYEFAAVVRNQYLYVLIPFSVLVSWMFFLLQGVSASCEDPFEGGVTDVPISTLTRVIEIDLLQMLGETEIPAPYQPRNGVLY